MDDLVKEFIQETVESLGELDTDLVKLEQDPNNADLLAKVFRLMHTIKGTCGFIGLPRLEKTAHAAENLLDLFRSGKKDITEMAMTVLFMSIDRVRYLVTEIEANGKEPDGNDADIIGLIEAEIAGGGATAKQPVAPLPAQAVETEPEDMPKPEEEAPPPVQVAPAEAPPTPAASSVPTAQGADKSPEFLRVPMSTLENLINMVSELVLTRNQLLQLLSSDEDTSVGATLQRLNRIASDLQEGIMKTRMQPIGNAWSKLPRIVRDLSTELNKKINLEMSGEDTELDRQVLEMIKDPLTHMVRNSCDHGIEVADKRRAAKKPETGTITLKAYHEGGFIIIQIADDGKGLDAKVIGKKAVEKGLITNDQLESMSDKQLLQLIFRPGFSMAEKVTSVSGRGVGMDVVRTNIEKIGGTINMDSVVGEGTTFTIQIPLTLAIISALIAEIDGLRYAIPQINVQELVRAHSSDKDKIEIINDRPVFRLRDRIIPLIDSVTLFGGFIPNDHVADQAALREKGSFEDKLIIVMNAGPSSFGLVVDAIHDMEEIVIKSISSILQNTKIFSGNTILGDGDVIMILDPAGIARQFEVSNTLSGPGSVDIGDSVIDLRVSERASMLIFRAASDTPKALPAALISRLQRFPREDITQSGDQIVVKYKNNLLPLYLTEADATLPTTPEITALILSDDVSDASIGIIIDEVLDILEDRLDLTLSTARPGVIGSVVLNGQTVDVLDIAHYLGQTQEDFFSSQAHTQAPYAPAAADNNNQPAAAYKGNPRILVVDDSPFFRNMLKPILASAGFQVTTSEDAVEAIRLHDNGMSFDLILSDIEMPHMTGFEFVEKMKQESKWKDLPFIALTSHTTAQDVEYGYKKGFTKYIGKFDKDELLRTINSVLTNRP